MRVLDRLGNIWFTSTQTSTERTIGMMDTSNGTVTNFVVYYPEGKVARSHGIYGSSDGRVYFNVSKQIGGAPTGNSILGMVDPLYQASENLRTTTGDDACQRLVGRGWQGQHLGGWRVSDAADGCAPLRSTYGDLHRVPVDWFQDDVIGITGDRDGNGWWMGVNEDVIEYSDSATGKVSAFALPEIPLAEYLKPGDVTENIPVTGVGGKQSPRRPRADHATTDVWVPTWFGNTIVRIDAVSKKATHIPMPYPAMNPYEIDVDTNHGVWVSFQNGDEVGRYNPAAGQWTLYTWPTRGTAQRQNNVVERNGVLEVIGAAGPSTEAQSHGDAHTAGTRRLARKGTLTSAPG